MEVAPAGYHSGVVSPLAAHALEDTQAWCAHPAHRWVYDRLLVASKLGYRCGPAGVEPEPGDYPIIWKPITNLWGMGRGAVVTPTCDGVYRPGFMWSPRYQGRHVSIDLMVQDGDVLWSAQAQGISSGPECFVLWVLGGDYPAELAAAKAFCTEHLPDYTGPLNIEFVGGFVIEVHLRLTRDWIVCGAYDDYPGPPRPTLGVQLFQATEDLPAFLHNAADDGDPRHAFVTGRLQSVT